MALGELVGRFERYNNTELRRMNLPGGFPFTITGRIVSGGYGFVIIIVILASSFHFAPHRDDVQPLGGGATGFEADIATNGTAGPSKSGTLNNEGDSVPFGVDAGDLEWDFATELRLISVDVTVTWSAGTSSVDAGAPTVSLQVTAGNFSETSQGTGFDASVTISVPVTVMGETVSGSSNSVEEFIASFEAEGPAVSGVITYEDDANPSPIKDEPLDYTLTCSLMGWELQNIREVSDV
ncbi:MAG: hypothetical protein QGE96_04440 [Candidatus Poseidoniia archaeon]|jgi:hypothetical protein|nr:hypothetical protein [Candidatus Poseidoniia archaeon]MDP7082596.1 hypothetical protein [Candidatus Poseidoniia archaeon]MDP7256205.1 hypothetical protein [Candidatus Poseidoniia archaeon]MDP7474280.1 hypothetical protein [Candidatus Poseidoniia archaeon]MDP7538744.1 hypothetical protein [Candidatus Poseidoniia archaeon]|tara:strand:+ start:68 stop:781 length:714 start_codon:yes stop_codon:yes gene_type:complete